VVNVRNRSARAGLPPLADDAQKPEIEAQDVAQACRGDQRAFERLYRAHAGWVFGLCLRLTNQRETAQDCTQEAFVAAWRALPRFEQRSQFSSWLYRIAVNTVLARRRRAGGGLHLVSADTHAPELERVAAPGEAAGPIDLERAIARLPQGARDVLVLVGLYGYSHDEASAQLGIAAGTSKAQLHRARALLAAQLGLNAESA
jgi:RNA polymerase sigma-70 factor (ECF subfamily)